MKFFRAAFFIFFVVFTLGCSHYSDIAGRVVDVTTGKPIEGALVVVQWTNTRGIPGLQYHKLHKIIETLTDQNGVFSISGTYGFLVDPPIMVIYKSGYVPSRNDSTLSESNTATARKWKPNLTYKLEPISNKYTRKEIWNFLDYGMTLGVGIKESEKFTEILRQLQ